LNGDYIVPGIRGRDGNGYVQMRSKGRAPDSTVVEFKCGDYIWSHDLNCNCQKAEEAGGQNHEWQNHVRQKLPNPAKDSGPTPPAAVRPR